MCKKLKVYRANQMFKLNSEEGGENIDTSIKTQTRNVSAIKREKLCSRKCEHKLGNTLSRLILLSEACLVEMPSRVARGLHEAF